MTITSLSALAIARRVREGILSPTEVVEAHIARIEAVNPALNAVVRRLFAAARQEAQAAEHGKGPPEGPLFCVPITVKDSFDVASEPATCGIAARADYRPDRDATLVARLRAAGAILLGKTNTPDNCFDQETENLLFGRTNNPWDLLRSVGGSTGGEAAIIAAGGSALGLGSDMAGSIRLPAAFTGIVGLRPTSAALPEQGFWPPSAGRLADLNATGPLARRVEDVAVALAVLRGEPPAPLDPGALAGKLAAFWFDDGLTPCSSAVRAGVRAAVAALQRAGMAPVERAPAARRLAAAGWAAYLDRDAREACARGFGAGEPWAPLAELRRSLRGEARVSSGALLYWMLAHYGSAALNTLGVDGLAWCGRLRAEFQAVVGGDGLAVCPVFPTTAPRHGWSRLAAPATMSYQMWVNLAGLPALALPAGRTGRGMPVGVQIVGMPGAEPMILAAGLVVQQALTPVWSGPLL